MIQSPEDLERVQLEPAVVSAPKVTAIENWRNGFAAVSGVTTSTLITEYRPPASLALRESLRLSELVGLTVNDVHIDDGWLKVFGKGDKERPKNEGWKSTIGCLLAPTSRGG